MGFAQYAGVFLPAVRGSLLLLLVAMAADASAAPPDVTSLFPAGGALGETVDVVATGTFDKWPLQIVCSNPHVQVECAKDKGKLQIKIAGEAAPGIAWLRLIDAEGASAPRPFVVAAQPSVREKEPNDSPKQAKPVSLPAVVQGKFDKSGDSDAYRVELAAGQTLVASLQSHEILGSPADGALQICNADGQVLAMNQDAGGLDSLVTYRAVSTGSYLVRTFALPATPNSSVNFAGGELYIYRLTITAGPFADSALPLAVKRSESTDVIPRGWNLVDGESVSLTAPTAITTTPWYWTPPGAAGLIPLRVVDVPVAVATSAATTAEGQSITVPCSISGSIAEQREVHRFAFAGKKGAKLTIAAESANLDFDLDPHLKLIAPSGEKVAEADDAGKDRDPTLNATLPADGNYLLEIRDLHRSGGPRHAYRLQIETPTPRLAMTVAAGSFLIEAGKTLEIPVTINRQGFAEEVSISAVDLPEGISVTAVSSQNKGDTAKQVKLTLTATGDAQAGPIKIVAKNKDDEEVAAATFAQTLGGSTFQHAGIWLAVKGSK